MEVDFPRGGAHYESFDDPPKTDESKKDDKKKSKKRRKEQQQEPDMLFGGRTSTATSDKLKGAKRHKESRSSQSAHKNRMGELSLSSMKQPHSLVPLGGGGVVMTHKQPLIERLGFNKLGKGTKLLGIVREIHDDFVIFSLPNLWTGYMLKDKKSQTSLSHMIYLGQVLAVVIIKAVMEDLKNKKQRRRIQVSILPSDVNDLGGNDLHENVYVRGQVQSVEDHGLLVNLGHGRRGFLRFDQIEGDYRLDEDDDDDKDKADEMDDGIESDGRVVSKKATDDEEEDDADDDKDEKMKDNKNDGDDNDDDDGHNKNDSIHVQSTSVVRRLYEGRVDDFLIQKTSQDLEKVITLAFPSNTERAKLTVPLSFTPTMQALCPGWLVKARTETLARNGLCVTFMGNVFRGAIESSHLGGFWIPTTRKADGSPEWKSVFDTDSIHTVTARIIAVDPATKLVRLSLLPHILEMNHTSHNSLLPPVGQVIDNATVIRIDPGVGALFALPKLLDEKPRIRNSKLKKIESYQEACRVQAAYVHISKAMDEKEDSRTPEGRFSKEFAPSTTHNLRITSTMNWVDGVASAACAPSILSAHVLTHADLVPGELYRDVPIIAELEGGHVLVDFGMGIRGFLAAKNMFDHSSGSSSDFRTQIKKQKFAVDQKINVRVLWVDVAAKRCQVTAKQSLLSTTTTHVISKYEGVKEGQLGTGYILTVDEKGLSVGFFNRINGRVTAKSLASELGIDDHQKNYKVGDVVQCRVISLRKRHRFRNTKDSKRRRNIYVDDNGDVHNDGDGKNNEEKENYFWEMMLSLRINADKTPEEYKKSNKKMSKEFHLRAGAIVPSKVMKVVHLVKGRDRKNQNDGFVPGYAIVRVKTKHLVNDNDHATDILPYIECKLPYDQLLDKYEPTLLESTTTLDSFAEEMLTVGKKIPQKGILLEDPHKSASQFSNGQGNLTVVSLRPGFVKNVELQEQKEEDEKEKAQDDNDDDGSAKGKEYILPGGDGDDHLYMGAKVLGYVVRNDPRHGCFIRFLNEYTGLIPKRHGGEGLPLYSTVVTEVSAIDPTSKPPKILLSKTKTSQAFVADGINTASDGISSGEVDRANILGFLGFKAGDMIAKAKIVELDFSNAWVEFKENKKKNLKARIHCSMAQCELYNERIKKRKYEEESGEECKTINKFHPFYEWEVGKEITDLRVVSVSTGKEGKGNILELTNRRNDEKSAVLPSWIGRSSQLIEGTKVSGIIDSVSPSNDGLKLLIGPEVYGFVPGLELSTDPKILNKMRKYFPVGARLQCSVVDKSEFYKRKEKVLNYHHLNKEIKTSSYETTTTSSKSGVFHLSLLLSKEGKTIVRPKRSDLVIGRINRSSPAVNHPALMLDLRAGFGARCCISELREVDEWVNFPLGRNSLQNDSESDHEDSMDIDEEENEMEEGDNTKSHPGSHDNTMYPHQSYVLCRVLANVSRLPLVDVSFRHSRIEGDVDEDPIPEVGELVHAYVTDTRKNGCFLRLARTLEGRTMLKELSDDFLPDPAASFPSGRLVVGKVKSVQKFGKQHKVDIDMKESTLIDSSRNKLGFADVELQSKHKATVTRVESYGVFVRIENTDVSGLVHKSECSDKFVKDIFELYDPGDLVKVLVIKKDDEERRIGFSMKASHFKDDEDSDDDEVSASGNMSGDEEDNEQDDDLDSDDGDFGSKLAARLQEKADGKISNDDSSSEDDNSIDSEGKEGVVNIKDEEVIKAKEKESRDEENEEDEDSEDSEEDSEEDEESEADVIGKDGESEEDEVEGILPSKQEMDTDVGFDWGTGNNTSSIKRTVSDSDEDSEEDADMGSDDDENKPSSHKSRKKQAQRRREEQEIYRRETALADGTADENPETAADFERVLSGNPDSSETWIRYMAFHLSLADIPAARSIAERAFERIGFRQEGEKLNVWCALLTLELKYGSEESLQDTITRACQHNNPKQVYLRVCEMMEKEATASFSSDKQVQADNMFAKMCKKFKSKKKVWISHLQYLLRCSRHEEAHTLLTRALKSLPTYKHVETMSKFAQLEFEFGSVERARTVFDGILLKYPKRLDLVFVYVDKELKHGKLSAARSIFENISAPPNGKQTKLSDKQMKSLFKKWYRTEEQHGTAEDQEKVKDAARAYVERTSST